MLPSISGNEVLIAGQQSVGSTLRYHVRSYSKYALVGLISAFWITAFANVSAPIFRSANELGELWRAEEIYFQPKSKTEPWRWNGVIYNYALKKCYVLVQDDDSTSVEARELKCDPGFLKKATASYTKISSFEKYRKKLLSCLQRNDESCIRGLVSKTLQVSFGVDGFKDRRDLIFETWKREDFKRLEVLIRKGTAGRGDLRRFPPDFADQGMGYRGEFNKRVDFWLLQSFLAGE